MYTYSISMHICVYIHIHAYVWLLLICCPVHICPHLPALFCPLVSAGDPRRDPCRDHGGSPGNHRGLPRRPVTLCLSDSLISSCDCNTRTRLTSLLHPQSTIQLLDRVNTSTYIYIYICIFI